MFHLNKEISMASFVWSFAIPFDYHLDVNVQDRFSFHKHSQTSIVYANLRLSRIQVGKNDPRSSVYGKELFLSSKSSMI